MLWVNMIMDSLASLALATEMPTKELLDRMPVRLSIRNDDSLAKTVHTLMFPFPMSTVW